MSSQVRYKSKKMQFSLKMAPPPKLGTSTKFGTTTLRIPFYFSSISSLRISAECFKKVYLSYIFN